MTTNNLVKSERNPLYFWIIGILSVAIPLAVAILFYMPKSGGEVGFNLSFLPLLNAVLNSATTVCLIAGFIFIKRNQQNLHITAMISAFALSSLFLISYVIYHYSAPGTKFGDLDHNGVVDAIEAGKAGLMRYFYFFILITHIILATAVVPFVLFAIYFGISRQLDRHKKIVKWTFPLWLYVAITGVLVYLMISPYYS